MKYRGKKRNIDYICQAEKIRLFKKEDIESLIFQVKFLGEILTKLGVENHVNHRRLLMKKMDEYGINYSHLKFDSARFLDLTGKTFGNLKVLERAETTKSGHTMWLCEEVASGIKKPVASTHLIRGNTKRFTKIRGEEHHQWKGFGGISGNLWFYIKSGAEKRKLEFNITIEYAWNLYLKQNRKCALSGLEIYFPESHKCPYNASLDRIDSSKGYVEGNVQWVHKKINIMKNVFSQREFFDLCKLVANNSVF